MQNQPTKLRIAHFPQIPCDPFYVDVSSIEDAYEKMKMLADYDAFQYEKRIKPDYANMTLLEEYDENEAEWMSWSIETDDMYFDDVYDYMSYMAEQNEQN